MNFIERLFHIAPDGGSGLFELAIAVALLIVPFAFVTARRKLKGEGRDRGL